MDSKEDETELSYKKTRRCCRNPASRMCHCTLAILFLVMMLVSFASLGIFAAKHNAISGSLPKSGSSNCILYTTKARLKNQELSDGVGCRFAIWGSAVVAVGCGLFTLGYVLKTVGGASLLTCLVCVELPFLTLLLIGALGVSINTTLGLALACNGFKDSSDQKDFLNASGNSCKEYSITKDDITFFDDILISEALSWAVTGALLMMFVVYFILTAIYCKGCSSSEYEDTQALLDEEKKNLEKPKREQKIPPKVNGSASASNNPFL